MLGIGMTHCICMQDLHRSMAARAKARPLTPVPFDAVIEDDGWEDCPFSSDVDVYRWPTAGSYLGGGATAQVFW